MCITAQAVYKNTLQRWRWFSDCLTIDALKEWGIYWRMPHLLWCPHGHVVFCDWAIKMESYESDVWYYLGPQPSFHLASTNKSVDSASSYNHQPWGDLWSSWDTCHVYLHSQGWFLHMVADTDWDICQISICLSILQADCKLKLTSTPILNFYLQSSSSMLIECFSLLYQLAGIQTSII